MSDHSHAAVYDPDELHLGQVEDCVPCNERTLPFAKDPPRIRDPELLGRFAEVRPRCQACGSKKHPHIHHMGDVPGVHRKSDVFENLARLCADCHTTDFHSQGGGLTRQTARLAKDRDEVQYREEYAELEMQYDGEVLWAT